MLCLDIDGTLLNSNHQISKKTRDAIEDISEKVPVILVSARMPAGILPFQRQLNIQEAIISYSGSLILDEDGVVILDKVISVADLRLLYSRFKDLVHISLYSNNYWYVESEDYWAKKEAGITGLTPEIINYHRLFDSWQSEIKEANQGIREDTENNEQMNSTNSLNLDIVIGANKVLCMGEAEDIRKLYNQLLEMKTDIVFYHSKPTYLEIMNKDVSKSLAIKQLAEKYVVKQSEIIAIGDNFNDIDMIKYAGLGVAMGNAPLEVKQAADVITSTNDNDGIVQVIEKYL